MNFRKTNFEPGRTSNRDSHKAPDSLIRRWFLLGTYLPVSAFLLNYNYSLIETVSNSPIRSMHLLHTAPEKCKSHLKAPADVGCCTAEDSKLTRPGLLCKPTRPTGPGWPSRCYPSTWYVSWRPALRPVIVRSFFRLQLGWLLSYFSHFTVLAPRNLPVPST